MKLLAWSRSSFWRKWKYGIFYFVAIPVFAFIYTFFPTGFYQSTVVQEGVVQNVQDQISESLAEVLRKKLSSSNGLSMRSQKFSCHKNNNSPITRTIHAVSPFFEYENGNKSATAVWASVTLLEECQDGTWLQTLFNINADILYGYHRKVHFTEFIPSFQFAGKSSFGEIFDLIKTTKIQCDELKVYFTGLAFNDDNCALIMNDDETQRFAFLLDQYNQSLNGKISGHNEFLRMFYLSTVTITTLGYGDIVPITDTTRFLVALQSILGLLFMALFVDSLVSARTTTH